MATISQTTFSNVFSWMKNGLMPTRRQAIMWTNDGLGWWCIYASLGLNELRTNWAICTIPASTMMYNTDIFFVCLFKKLQLLVSPGHLFRRYDMGWIKEVQLSCYLAPVPLSIFRSNSKFDENSKHSSFEYARPITTIFCTRHDSVTVVTCAKYRCDRSSIFETRAFWIFIEFRIQSKYV